METERTLNALQHRKDFIDAVDNYHKKNPQLTFIQCCPIVAVNEAPKFYVSTKYAIELYSKFKSHGKLPILSALKTNMFLEIFRLYDNYISQHPNMKCSDAMDYVLNQPASCFFIEPSQAHFFYYKAIKSKRK